MKKKIIATFIILCMMASIIYGCGLFKTNSERDYEQVIATVGDDNYKDEITKRQLVSLYLSQGSTYVESYGYTVGQTMELFLNQLINNRVLIQVGAAEIIEKKGFEGTIKDYLNKDAATGKKSESLRKLVGEESYTTAKSNMYKYLRSTLDSYEDQVESDWATETPSDAPTPTPTPTPSPTPRPTPNPSATPTETPLLSEDPYPTTPSRIEAYKRFLEDLEDQEKTKDEIMEETLVSYLESEVISQYQKILYESINITFKNLEDRKENMQITQEQEYGIDFDAYITKLESATKDTIMLSNPLQGYGYVKNLLIPFTGDVADKLAESQNKEWSNEQYLSIRAELLDQIEVKDLREGITQAQRDLNSYGNIQDFYSYFKGVFGGIDNGSGVYTYPENSFNTNLINTFVDLIFQYGTDPGMFNNTMDYLSQPKPEEGEAEKYVTEFADAARAVVKGGVGSYTLVGTDFGWHIIICTEIVGNINQNVNETDYGKITADLSKYDELGKDVTDTFTYKLYNSMRNTQKNNIYSNKVEELVKAYTDASKITKYEDRYSELTSIE